MRAAIVGGAGFVGSHVVKKFLDNDYDVDVLDAYHYYGFPEAWYANNLSYRREELLDGATLIRCDVLDIPNLYGTIRHGSYDYIVNLAALPIANQSGRARGEASSALQGGINIMEAIVGTNVLRYTYISSSMAYGNYQTVPVPEDSLMNPVNIYGGLKLAGEVIVKTYSRVLEIPYTIVRPAAAYGPSDCNMRVVQKFLHQAFAGEPVTVVVGEDMVMDFTFVKDTAQGIFLATTMNSGEGQTFNITRGQGRSLEELVDIIKLYFEDLEVIEIPDKNIRPKRGASDISKANMYLQYRPRWTLEDGVAAYVEYLYENLGG